MSLLQTVRTTTASKHDLMENLIGADRLNNFSIDDYKLLLSTNFIFHSHVEEKIRKFLSETEPKEQKQIAQLEFQERIKAIFLEHELQEMLSAETFEALKFIPNTVSFLDYYSLLGYMYVAEGSMLGGKTMYKILSQNTQINDTTTFEFFKSYQEKTSSLWKSFRELVEEDCQTQAQKEHFLEGAEKSYLYFEKSFYTAKNILEKNK